MLATTLFSTLALVAGVNALPSAAPLGNNSNLGFGGVARFNGNDFSRRSYTGDGTFYAAGTGNCGGTNTDADSIVAISSSLYYSQISSNGWQSNLCNQCVSISYGGKTKTATIVDSCPECAEYDLDMSKSLFTYFADESVGRMTITWDFAPCDGDVTTTSSEAVTPSQTPVEQPTSTTISEAPTEPTTTSAPPPSETPATTVQESTIAPTQESTTVATQEPTIAPASSATESAPTQTVSTEDPSAAPTAPSQQPSDPSAAVTAPTQQASDSLATLSASTDGPAAPSSTGAVDATYASATTAPPTSPVSSSGASAPTKTRKCRAKRSKRHHKASH